jgi:ubiquinone/menaquinone biosynthesis C-methylase UbiE
MSGDARETVQREFTHQAQTFGAGSFFAQSSIAEWIDAGARLAPHEIVLDAGGGAGDLSRELAARARQFVIADITDAMRERGRDQAEAAGVENLLFVRAALEDLPFPDRSFDVVLCRFVLHHLADPAPVLAELARVVRPHGRVVVADMVAQDGALGERYNHFERVRDPSHTTALTRDALLAAIAAAGLTAGEIDVIERRPELERWLTQAVRSVQDERTVRGAVAAELDGGEPTGLEPRRREDGTITFGHRWLRVTATARAEARPSSRASRRPRA